jgi:ribosomal protein S18 acetylase RimI-like enzyme
MPTRARTSPVLVRALRREDADRVIALDARIVGRRREAYFGLKLREAFEETGVRVSLAAEHEEGFAGFLLARVYYGEFGVAEPEAVLDTLGVAPEARGHGVGRALLAQLRMNLAALGIRRLRTEVDWSAQDLMHFFHAQGFAPAARLCLDVELDPAHSGRHPMDEIEPDEGPPAA